MARFPAARLIRKPAPTFGPAGSQGFLAGICGSSTQVASEFTSLQLTDGIHGFSNTQDFVFAAESPGYVSDRRGVVVAIRRGGKQGQTGSRRHVAAPAR